MEKNEAMKMTIGSTWKAKTTPNGPLLAPSGPNTNWLPASAYSSMALTPTPMAWKTLPKSGLQHQEREGELQAQAPGEQRAA